MLSSTNPCFNNGMASPSPVLPQSEENCRAGFPFLMCVLEARFHFSSMATVVAGFPNSSHIWQARATGWPSSMASRQTIRITALHLSCHHWKPIPRQSIVGSWIQYGLGTLNQNMPGYVVVQDPRGAPCNGVAVWANGYLPAVHQGHFEGSRIPDPHFQRPEGITSLPTARGVDAIRALNQRHAQARPSTPNWKPESKPTNWPFVCNRPRPRPSTFSRAGVDAKALRARQG